MAQRYQISVQEYVNTRSLRDFSEDVMAYYCEVLAPVAAIAEAFGGAEEDDSKGKKPRQRSAEGRPKDRNSVTRKDWFKPAPNGRVHNIGKKGEPIPQEVSKALRSAAQHLMKR
jgi:hypothetical protein